MTERTLIQRHTQRELIGIPDTCPTCRSVQIISDHGEWRCSANGCFTRSEGWNMRPSTPEDSGSGETPAGGTDDASMSSNVTDSPQQKRGSQYTTDELLAFLHSAIKDGRSPSRGKWDTGSRPDGAPTAFVYVARFGSWTEALAAAGLEPNNRGSGAPRSQPAPGALAAGAAETAAAAPPQAVVAEEPDVRASAKPAGVSGQVEQPLPPTYAEKPVDLVVRTAAAMPARITIHEQRAIATHDDARDELQLRYARALLATLESAEITEPAEDDFFAQLCDRIERVIGLQEAS